MYKIDDKVEFKDPQARKWVPGTIVDEDNGFYEIERASGKVKVGIPVDLIRVPGAAKLVTAAKEFAKKADSKPKKGKIIGYAKTGIVDVPKDSASIEFHRDLQYAYDGFNTVLFEGKLPGAFWTTIQKRSVLAHYKPKAWVQGNRGNGIVDEIMINPDYLPIIGLEDFLSSIVHEQAHQYQHHHGTAPRPGYHDEEFAGIMERIGLQPSNTGKEGGKRVGQSMDHYIIGGGLFDIAVKKMIGEGFALSWVGAVHELHGIGVDYVPGLKSGKTADVGEKPKKKKPTRGKFVCPVEGCKETAQAKFTANIMCGEHKEMMEAV
ncbi:SprT-like domain-containing protein [bacterium]|nr:SprT-like domain-containing protein [bacterium]